MNLIIDIGNTAAKLAVFDHSEPLTIVHTSPTNLEALPELMRQFACDKGILSSVVDLSDEVKQQLQSLPFPLIKLSATTPLPITLEYRTPQTLGADRIAAVVGAWTIKPDRDLLVIDAGTCITYEFVDASGVYRGGNISPGLQMRFQALHAYTSHLPLIGLEGEEPLMGYDTETAIRNGVKRGVELEIEGYIDAFCRKYPELFVFLTGGDGFHFVKRVKNRIFADNLLVPRGLNRILEYNDK